MRSLSQGAGFPCAGRAFTPRRLECCCETRDLRRKLFICGI